jgi:hypothetical protein
VVRKKPKTMMWRPSLKTFLSADTELAGNSCLDFSLKEVVAGVHLLNYPG